MAATESYSLRHTVAIHSARPIFTSSTSPCASATCRRRLPIASPPLTTVFYTASRDPGELDVDTSFSHDSLTRKRPATHTPVMNRRNIHGMGDTHTPCTTTVAEASDASDEKTRMWPTRRIIPGTQADRSEEHTSELQSLMRISYAVFCLTNKTTTISTT